MIVKARKTVKMSALLPLNQLAPEDHEDQPARSLPQHQDRLDKSLEAPSTPARLLKRSLLFLKSQTSTDQKDDNLRL